LRDISRVIQGILLIKPYQIKDVDGIIRLWIHECSRVFSDKFNSDDKEWFNNLILELVAS
jgi:dynein heavy chain, axonemal